MTFNATKYSNALVCFDIPKSKVMVFRYGEKEVWILWVKPELINALTMTDIMFDTIHGSRAEESNDSS